MPINIEKTRLQSFSHLELIARQVVEGFITGLHKSPFHGFSVEFDEHRMYNQGESLRHIDWKLYARTKKLYVKRYEEETNVRCQIVIDCSSSMLLPEKRDNDKTYNKIGFSVYAAAALTEIFRKQRDAVGLSLFSDDVKMHTPSKTNEAHNNFIFTQLEKLLQNDLKSNLQQTAVAENLDKIAEMTHKRSLIIIFSDMFDKSDRKDKVISALQHLKHNKHEVILFHVNDKPKELDFEFNNRSYEFVDPETGEKIKLHPNQIKKDYIKKVNSYIKDLELTCGQLGIDFIPADINQGFHQVLQPYLIKRKKMLV